jgi:hypothetical protein
MSALAPPRRRPHMLNKERVRERDMRQFEFSTGHDGQGRVKPIIGGTGYMFPGAASYPEFSECIDALQADLERMRGEAKRYFDAEQSQSLRPVPG